ncbi:hypothetical protein ACSS6W_010337 [Trichoderma asperelloides]
MYGISQDIPEHSSAELDGLGDVSPEFAMGSDFHALDNQSTQSRVKPRSMPLCNKPELNSSVFCCFLEGELSSINWSARS